MSTPYNTYVTLLRPVTATCWNFSNNVTATIPKGSTILIKHAYDATSTTIVAGCTGDDPKLKQGGLLCSNGKQGYRFIIPNKELNAAAGKVLVPDTTADIIGDIIAAEAGNTDATQRVLDSGINKQLQGAWSSKS